MDLKKKYLKLNKNDSEIISKDNLKNPIFIIDGTKNTYSDTKPIVIMWDNPYYDIIKHTFDNLTIMDESLNVSGENENMSNVWKSRFNRKKSFQQGNDLFIVSNDNYRINMSTYNIVMCINLDTDDIIYYQMVVFFKDGNPKGYLKHRRFYLFKNI